ncbi:YciI family protein [Agrococcus sp. SL85]|uniref:YciI family protein n=1 Tax=Agrococcus sp. SL85 TaxID=2995141 RepID=UPI00226CF7E1|nr:YciI family protein [Agrococcus sp. SL85]WAC66614.1 YciI family protein [Agrococcus sp. SL85]
MRFLLVMRDEDVAAIDRRDAPFEAMLAAMGAYNAAMSEAGVLVAAEGLAEPEAGVVVDFSADPPLVTDGPYGETKELFNGFWIVDVADQAEAARWAARAPLGPGTKLEIRRMHTEADLQR